MLARRSAWGRYGGAADRSQQIRALGGASTSSSPRRAARSTTCAAGRWISTGVEVLVLDEADEMLDMGFADELDAILEATPAERQTALFSATMPPRIASIAERHLGDPVRVHDRPGEAASRQAARGAPDGLSSWPARRRSPRSAACSISRRPTLAPALLPHADRSGHPHGNAERAVATAPRRCTAGMNQEQRDRVMKRDSAPAPWTCWWPPTSPRAGSTSSSCPHVVNYDVPASPEAYVHRIGRTGPGRTRRRRDHLRRAARSP